jgi:hypothetical protein
MPIQLLLAIVALASSPVFSSAEIQRGEMAGYLRVPNEGVSNTFNAGFPMYVAAGPPLKTSQGIAPCR